MTPAIADPSPWQRVRRVLVVRLDNLGDVLMTTPALHAIRRSLPGVHITLLGSRMAVELARHLDDVDDAITFDAPWMKVREAGRAAAATTADDLQMLQRLRAARFDAAIVFTCYTQSALPAALFCQLAGVPLRLAHSRENPYALLTHWVRETEPEQGVRHEVERQLALVASVGCEAPDRRLRFALREVDVASFAIKAAQCGLRADRPWVVVHPGASAPSRRYPAERFGQAAALVARAVDCDFIFTGGADEAPAIETARAALDRPSISFAGRLSLGELAALVARAKLLVTNNSGPAHLAAALGTPVVDLYALTNPQHTPWLVPSRVLNHDVPCRGCLKSVCPHGHHHCLTLVMPDEVAAAALELLGTGAREGAADEPRAAPMARVVRMH